MKSVDYKLEEKNLQNISEKRPVSRMYEESFK